MTISDLSRRVFVGSVGALTVATAGGAQPLTGRPITDATTAFAERLSALLPHRDSALVVGRVAGTGDTLYRLCAETLDRVTTTHGLGMSDLAALPDADLRTLLARQMRQDFRDGRIVVVDGWRLSQTEVAIAGLVGALSGNSGETVSR